MQLDNPKAILAWLNKTGTHLVNSKAKTHLVNSNAETH